MRPASSQSNDLESSSAPSVVKSANASSCAAAGKQLRPGRGALGRHANISDDAADITGQPSAPLAGLTMAG
ncbi:MAG TPA: hypothetical protein VF226_16565 [Hyphomicrobiaceae bacterium]|jgi:hypothetical protein